MKKIHFRLELGSAVVTDAVEFEDDASNSAIDRVFEQWKEDNLEASWYPSDTENAED